MKHSLTYTGTDWLLKIWEPALPTSTRTLPFLYKAQHRFATEAEALEALARYQQFNDSAMGENLSEMAIA
ncbi:MAG TPA: hypothetical protein IGS37_03965 [Synechococcales cyanobacterium M55_K2018_004]|nr:hypothetical protein [Synechococcales cyanobacterium M55_K2018_004]